jgi:hypothetical protein
MKKFLGRLLLNLGKRLLGELLEEAAKKGNGKG